MGVLVYKYDKLWLGLAIGLVTPLIFLTVMYFQESSFVSMLFTSFLRIGLIFNLAIFLLVFNTGFDKLPKGILLATILYGLVIVYQFLFS
ncbi:MAG: hypothetical protein H6605_09975 [Flavobacteriales bacterium]|nr:hypothetical protein [Flavobacteriales bacterium]